MNARVAAVLLVLLVVLGGTALIYQREDRQRRPSNAASLGQVLFKDLKAADIASIRIAEAKNVLTLERKDERWTLAERGGFPADFARVREFVLKAIELKAGQSEPIGEKDRARLNLDDSGTQIDFRGAGGKPLGTLIIGKKYFKREVENPAKAIGDGRFVLQPADPKIVYLVADPLIQATAKTGEWIERAAFQAEKVKTLEVKFPEGGGYRIERNADNADWKLAGSKPGEKLDISKANAASYSLSLLDLADVLPNDTKDTGLDKPAEITAVTLDGLTYSIKVGKLQGDNYFTTFTSSGTIKPDAKDAERSKKLEERQPRERMLQNYVLLIPKGRLEDTLKKRPEFLEKREDKKKK
ncbi:MAG TPA: DUF4340 domain-containing protein [Burkholderiales bacterium]|nr:DUF4340 domain-containing protein [Burkholderiales bacterium]